MPGANGGGRSTKEPPRRRAGDVVALVASPRSDDQLQSSETKTGWKEARDRGNCWLLGARPRRGWGRGPGQSAFEDNRVRGLEPSRRFQVLRSGSSLRPRMRLQPSVGQELAERLRGMRRQPFQDVLEVGERINLVTLAAGHQAVQRRRRPAASVAPDEKVVLPLMRRSA